MKTKIAVIIVTFNRLALLKECIESVRKQTYQNYDIIVINNGSTDNTLQWLSAQADIIIINQENSGGAGGFYTGLKYSCEHGYSYSWIMDDDVIADANALYALMDKRLLTKGFLCSRVFDSNGELCNVPKLSIVKSSLSNEYVWGNYLDNRMLRVDVASFVSVLIDNRVVYEIGLPYRDYFIWGDDTEYTSRISSKYASFMVIDSFVTHKRKIQTILSIFSEKDKKRYRNFYFLYRNRIHLQHCIWMKIIYWLYAWYHVVLLLLKGQFIKSGIILKAALNSLFFHPSISFPEQK